MRLYLTIWGDPGTPKVKWDGTQADARATRKEHSLDKDDTKEVDVPTDKAGLLAFLNERQVGE